MVQKSDALFVLIGACFLYYSKLYTSLLSITAKLIILFINFFSASIYTSDMRKSEGDKKRKLKFTF